MQQNPQRRQMRSRSRTRQRPPIQRAYDKQIVSLVVVLLMAGMVCLSSAYYLFRTALGDSSSTGSLRTFSGNPPRRAELRALLSEPSEKFLAYLPHSGYHNQRIALENALVLARILNRTLLLPPVRLGTPLSYAPFGELYQMSANARKSRLRYCRDITYGSDMPTECEEYFGHTQLSWDWLIDLSSLQEDQRLLEGWNFTDAWLGEYLGISADDVFYLNDTARNEFAFQDFFSFESPSRKYLESVPLSTLARKSERLIQLGTLFGSSRLHFRSSTNYQLRRTIRERMVFTNPHLVRAAEEIRSALGGAYFGVHLRIGDGIFEWNAPEIVRLAWWKLLHSVLGFTDETILRLEQEFFPDEDDDLEPPLINPDLPALRTPHPPLPAFPLNATPSPEFACRAPLHTSAHLAPLNAPLFISTDAQSPTFNPLLARFTRTFPCSFFLEDFPEQMAPLGTLKSPVDGVPLGRFLMPFLDAMVVGQAWQVVGTEQSTFSAFVTDVLWRRYHGFEIVQRG
ncbi:hypothetical protein OH77DRAFT_1496012 [Trametes cingulata]|nr:hypothetical protein OH77DRAFT_1496012 [Trametes cingulata]